MGKPGREAGAPAWRKSPKDREDGGGGCGRGAGTLASSCGVTLAWAPQPWAAGKAVGMPLSGGPDFPAQPSSRNARAEAFSDSDRFEATLRTPALPCLPLQLPSR
ncbi:hypothetical protein LEMLEM_LOCUS26000 [Lemmus lemmus]